MKAVDGISFDLFEGETLCVVGESGSGKSVAARSILQIVDRPGEIVAGEMLLHRYRGRRDRRRARSSISPNSAAAAGDMQMVRRKTSR